MRVRPLILFFTLIGPLHADAFLGTELGPLLQLVSGQITEIERLTEGIGATRDQTRMLRELNEGVEQAVSQIRSIEAIIERAQSLEPGSVKSLSDLNDLHSRANQLKVAIDDLMQMKMELTDQAIESGALQSDTAYRMGQEMVATGSQLSGDSRNASPGRASQITASASSAQMLAKGVELQTLAQLVQLQAMSLELQKSQIDRDLRASKARRMAYERELAGTKGGRR